MPTLMNLEEAQKGFFGLVDFVQANNSAITIMSSGRPVVRVMPIRSRRNLEPDSLLAGAKISDQDLFDDMSDEFEVLNHD